MGGVHHMISSAAAAALGKKTLKEVVFNASGTFTVPANAINNEFYVGCTGGGGGGTLTSDGSEFGSNTYGGGGSGRVSAKITLTAGENIPVTIGAGGVVTKVILYPNGYNGGTTSFGGYVSCLGGIGAYQSQQGLNNGVSGGGDGGKSEHPVRNPTASNCPAMFTVDPTAIDNTNKFYEAKSFIYTNNTTRYATGGAGCYWRGGEWSTETMTARPNTGGGGQIYISTTLTNCYGGSGKVVIYYYTYE